MRLTDEEKRNITMTLLNPRRDQDAAMKALGRLMAERAELVAIAEAARTYIQAPDEFEELSNADLEMRRLVIRYFAPPEPTAETLAELEGDAEVIAGAPRHFAPRSRP